IHVRLSPDDEVLALRARVAELEAQADVDFDGLHALPSCLSNPTLHSGAAGPLCGPPPSPLLGKSIPI
ncbi:hypothetical protein NE659_27815, partial [Flavonifractor plautii]|uniref:hypothetical protein n=1 Tax=Flavonifractor plautii TaxID=292800 RepID=UPI00210E4146